MRTEGEQLDDPKSVPDESVVDETGDSGGCGDREILKEVGIKLAMDSGDLKLRSGDWIAEVAVKEVGSCEGLDYYEKEKLEPEIMFASVTELEEPNLSLLEMVNEEVENHEIVRYTTEELVGLRELSVNCGEAWSRVVTALSPCTEELYSMHALPDVEIPRRRSKNSERRQKLKAKREAMYSIIDNDQELAEGETIQLRNVPYKARNYSNDSDEVVESFQPQAFAVDGEPDFESGPPQDGWEYLRRVIWETARCPKVVVADIDPEKLVSEQTPYMPEIPAIPSCPSELLPSKAWEREFLADFTHLRMELAKLSAPLDPSAERLPTLRNKVAWEIFCFGSVTSTQAEDLEDSDLVTPEEDSGALAATKGRDFGAEVQMLDSSPSIGDSGRFKIENTSVIESLPEAAAQVDLEGVLTGVHKESETSAQLKLKGVATGDTIELKERPEVSGNYDTVLSELPGEVYHHKHSPEVHDVLRKYKASDMSAVRLEECNKLFGKDLSAAEGAVADSGNVEIAITLFTDDCPNPAEQADSELPTRVFQEYGNSLQVEPKVVATGESILFMELPCLSDPAGNVSPDEDSTKGQESSDQKETNVGIAVLEGCNQSFSYHLLAPDVAGGIFCVRNEPSCDDSGTSYCQVSDVHAPGSLALESDGGLAASDSPELFDHSIRPAEPANNYTSVTDYVDHTWQSLGPSGFGGDQQGSIDWSRLSEHPYDPSELNVDAAANEYSTDPLDIAHSNLEVAEAYIEDPSTVDLMGPLGGFEVYSSKNLLDESEDESLVSILEIDEPLKPLFSRVFSVHGAWELPLMRTLLRLDVVSRSTLFRFHISWLESLDGNLPQERALWLLGLAAVIDTPLNGDTTAAFRAMLRYCAGVRASKQSPSVEELYMLNALITIAGLYFGQAEADLM